MFYVLKIEIPIKLYIGLSMLLLPLLLSAQATICLDEFIQKTKQKGYSDYFISEVLETCISCKKDSCKVALKGKDSFHNLHVYFFNDGIDDAFQLSSMLLEQYEDNPLKVYVLHVMRGLILNKKQLYNDAITELHTALTLGKTLEVSSVKNIYAVLGQLYIDIEDFQKSIDLLEEWKTSQKIDSSSVSAGNLHNLGLAYLHKEAYENAEMHLLKSHSFYKNAKDTLGLAVSSLDIANLYYTQYKDDLAIAFFEKGLDYAKKTNELLVLQNAYLNLAVVNENAKDFAKALGYRKLYEKIHDSIWNRDNIWQMAQNDKKIAAKINAEKLQTEKYKTIAYSILALFLFIVLILGSYSFLKIRKQHQIIIKQKDDLNQLNDTKDKLFSILTHDLKTPIHNIKNKLFQVLNLKESNRKQHLEWIQDGYYLSKKTALLLDNTLHWVLAHKNQLLFYRERLYLNAIVHQVIHDYTPIIREKKIHLDLNLDTNAFVFSDLNALKMVFRNVLDNAIKFSFPESKIIVKTACLSKHCELHIIDFGIGFEPNTQLGKTISKSTSDTTGKTSTGLGLQLCYDLIKKNKGFFKVKSKINTGTEIKITLPSS